MNIRCVPSAVLALRGRSAISVLLCSRRSRLKKFKKKAFRPFPHLSTEGSPRGTRLCERKADCCIWSQPPEASSGNVYCFTMVLLTGLTSCGSAPFDKELQALKSEVQVVQATDSAINVPPLAQTCLFEFFFAGSALIMAQIMRPLVRFPACCLTAVRSQTGLEYGKLLTWVTWAVGNVSPNGLRKCSSCHPKSSYWQAPSADCEFQPLKMLHSGYRRRRIQL